LFLKYIWSKISHCTYEETFQRFRNHVKNSRDCMNPAKNKKDEVIKMKKIVSLILVGVLAAAMVMSMTACGKKEAAPVESAAEAVTDAAADAAEAVTAAAADAAEAVTDAAADAAEAVTDAVEEAKDAAEEVVSEAADAAEGAAEDAAAAVEEAVEGAADEAK